MSTIIYFHGFLSSPKSKKARQTNEWLAEQYPDWKFVSPNLSPHALVAKNTIQELLSSVKGPKFLIGSSLGGFWCTWAIENGLADKAVLINPAVKPYRRFRMSLGDTFEHFYSDESYTINAPDLDELKNCSPSKIEDPSRYWVMLQEGDEVLDYSFAQSFYSECKQTVEPGGDHAFVGYENHLPAIMQFFSGQR